VGVKAGEEGSGKTDGPAGTAAGATSVSPGTGGVGTAVETARSSPPVIWSQKQGPSVGDVVWWPAMWCTAV
jgi:hypothetical protein